MTHEANELPGEGHAGHASDGLDALAQPRHPNEDEAGQSDHASNGHDPFAPSSSPDRGGEGQNLAASIGLESRALPVREPSIVIVRSQNHGG